MSGSLNHAVILNRDSWSPQVGREVGPVSTWFWPMWLGLNVGKRLVLIQHFPGKNESQSIEITSNFPHHSSKTCIYIERLCGQGPCTLNSVNDMNEPHCIQIKPFMGQAYKARRSSWGWNDEISPHLAERATAGCRGAEQSPLTNGSLPTLGLSVSMKSPLPHSC